MITAQTQSPRAPARLRGPWRERMLRVVRYFGMLEPALAPVPMTRRQVLLAAQDKWKSEDRARRLALVRQLRGVNRLRS